MLPHPKRPSSSLPSSFGVAGELSKYSVIGTRSNRGVLAPLLLRLLLRESPALLEPALCEEDVVAAEVLVALEGSAAAFLVLSSPSSAIA